MSDRQAKHRLCDISTRWSLIFNAHQSQEDARHQAQAALMERYFGDVYRYFAGRGRRRRRG